MAWIGASVRACAAWVAVTALAVACGGSSAGSPGSGPDVVRIGYPVTTLINGQIGQVLARTNILDLNGLKGTLVPFTAGPATNDALAAGSIDVGLTSEGPAALGISQGLPVEVVATFGTTRDALLVPRDSKVRGAADLRGKSIGVPFGTTPFLHLSSWLGSQGLDAARDVQLVNIGADVLASALATGQVQAVEYNEPLPTQLERTAGARTISSDELAYATLARRDFLQAHRDAARRLMIAFAEAGIYMERNQALVDGWFASVSRADPAVIHEASLRTAVYAETRTPPQIDFGLSSDFVQRLQRNADFFANQKLIKSAARMRGAVDTGLWREAAGALASARFDPAEVKVVRSP
ncbi:MAG TPA: NrtA/SsuA/CpmA family ABC transporter substrate-binding protein [Candidatus Dormibacteraeota bacterium]|nr:NrtA/SsuA/CpmA family ABC transporter substrate-binding protein [Candidatus Dormibacteraeota bacterium]